MKREALLVYLQDLRDLEVAKYQIEKMIKNNNFIKTVTLQNIQCEIDIAEKANYWKLPNQPEPVWLIMEIMGIILIFGSFFFRWLGIPLIDMICMVIGVLGTIIWGVLCVCEYKRYIKEKKEVKLHNIKEKERLEMVVPSIIKDKHELQQKIIKESNSKEQYLKNELEKVVVLLKESYSLNIIASTYRNLASIYYIYEYMSTSQSSLEDTFIHEHMENGIKRIENKLDIIIEQNRELIFSVRQIEVNTHKTVKQTTEMLTMLQQNLESQQRTEQNTLEAAQYAAICATYSKTNAFFSMANYLTKNNSI